MRHASREHIVPRDATLHPEGGGVAVLENLFERPAPLTHELGVGATPNTPEAPENIEQPQRRLSRVVNRVSSALESFTTWNESRRTAREVVTDTTEAARTAVNELGQQAITTAATMALRVDQRVQQFHAGRQERTQMRQQVREEQARQTMAEAMANDLERAKRVRAARERRADRRALYRANLEITKEQAKDTLRNTKRRVGRGVVKATAYGIRKATPIVGAVKAEIDRQNQAAER